MFKYIAVAKAEPLLALPQIYIYEKLIPCYITGCQAISG